MGAKEIMQKFNDPADAANALAGLVQQYLEIFVRVRWEIVGCEDGWTNEGADEQMNKVLDKYGIRQDVDDLAEKIREKEASEQ